MRRTIVDIFMVLIGLFLISRSGFASAPFSLLETNGEPTATRGAARYHGQPSIESVFVPIDDVEFENTAKWLDYTVVGETLYIGDTYKGGVAVDFASGNYEATESSVNFALLPTGVADASNRLYTINGLGPNRFNFNRFHRHPYEGYQPSWGHDGLVRLDITVHDLSNYNTDHTIETETQTLNLSNLTGYTEAHSAKMRVDQYFATRDGKLLLLVEVKENYGSYDKFPVWLLHDTMTDETTNLGATLLNARDALELDMDMPFYFSTPYVYAFENTDVFQDDFFPTQVVRWNIETDTIEVKNIILQYAVDGVLVKPAGDQLFVFGGETGEATYYRHEDGSITHTADGDADADDQSSNCEDWGVANIRVQRIDFPAGEATLTSEMFYDGLNSADGGRQGINEPFFPCDYGDGTYMYLMGEVNQLFTWGVEKPPEGFNFYRWKYPNEASIQPPNDAWIEWDQGDEKCTIEWNPIDGAKGYRVYDPRLLYKDRNGARIGPELITDTSYAFTLSYMKEHIAGKDLNWYVVSAVAEDGTDSAWSINADVYSEIFHLSDDWKEPYGIGGEEEDEGIPGFGVPLAVIGLVVIVGAVARRGRRGRGPGQRL